MKQLLIKNGNCFIDGKWEITSILIEDEKIKYIGNDDIDIDDVFDATGLKIIPGLIDPHVHFDLDCGTVTSVDSFDTGSISAIYGGVTTIIDFLDPARNAIKLKDKFYDRLSLAKNCHVDYHLHGCIKEPDGDLEKFVLQLKRLGMNTIKLFTTYSETHRRTYDEDIKRLLVLSKKYKFLVCCHIENDELVDLKEEYKCTDIATARPSEAEITETLKLASFVRETGGYLYMVHCSSGETVKRLKEEYGDILGTHLILESCPQYFSFDKSVLDDANGCLFTFAPPLRSKEEKEALIWNFDSISTIGTDHCAFMEEDKRSHPMLIGHPLGIGGIESSFLVMHKLFGDSVIDKMSKNVADLEGFSSKGAIKVGKDADLVFIQDTPTYPIGKPHGTSDYSIYEGIEVNEKIIHTMLRGNFILKDGEYLGSKGELVNCDKELSL